MFPDTIRDVLTEIYVNDAWIDVSGDVQHAAGVTIKRGRGDESPRCSAQQLSYQLDDREGHYSPRNPLGDYYPSFGLNTPTRCGFREIRDTYTRTVVDGLGSTDTGQTYTLVGTAANYDVGGSTATILVPTASTDRLAYLAASTHRNITAYLDVTFTTPASGNNSLGIALRGTSSSSYLTIGADVTPAGVVRISIWDDDTSTLLAGPTTVAGVGIGSAVRIMAQVDGDTLRGKLWNPSTAVEPYDWDLSVNDTGLAFAGWVGIRARTGAGNTNVTFTVDNLVVIHHQITAEISSPPRGQDITGGWRYTDITARGILQRLSQGQPPLKSALRRAYLSDDIDSVPVAYWPCEDGSDSTSIASAYAGHPPMILNVGEPAFASNSEFVASDPLPVVNGSRWIGKIPAHTPTGTVVLRWLMRVPAGHTDNVAIIKIKTTGSAAQWDVAYQSAGNLSVNIFDAAGTVLSAGGDITFSCDDRLVRVTLELEQNGTAVDWAINTLDVESGVGGGFSTSFAANTLGYGTEVWVNPGTNLGAVVIGHITVQTAVTSLFDLASAVRGYVGETAGRRLERLCLEEAIPFGYQGDLDDTAAMGAQRSATLMDLLNECADADLGTLHEGRGHLELKYRTQASLNNQIACVALDHDLRQLGFPFSPIPDDQLVRNRVTAKRVNGSEAHAVLESGRLSILAPQNGGAGSYGRSETVNVETDDQLPDVASFLLAQGTVDEDRYPDITIDVARAAIATDTTQRWRVLDVDVDDLFTITNTADMRIYADIRQIVRGYTHTFTQFEHELVINCTPAAPYDVIELDADTARLDTEGSELAVAVDEDDTGWSVATTSGPLWSTAAADVPMTHTIGGERVSVTDIDPELITFVAAGTAAHADNAAVSPGLPAGHATGNLLLILAAIRSTSGTPNTPAGYQLLWEPWPGPTVEWSNIRLFGKIDNGAEGTPSVSFFNGSAGDTCSAQMACFTGKWYDLANLEVVVPVAAGISNASAQDIAHPALFLRNRHVPLDNSLIIYAGWKQDDWTSVASPGTEIGEPASTTGSDQGLVWSYQIQTAATDIAAGSFTVTGGGAAISKGGVCAIRCDRQAFTVTRNLGGLPGGKSHGVGSAIRLADPTLLALTGA